MKKAWFTILIFVFVLSLVPLECLAAKYPSWTYRIKRGANYEIWRNGENLIWNSAEQWILENGVYVPYTFYEDGNVIKVSTGYVAVEWNKGSGFAKYWSPGFTEVAVYEEMWEVQYWSSQGQGSWKTVAIYDPVFDVDLDSEVLNVTVSFTTSYPNAAEKGLNITYCFDGMLKHVVVFENFGSETRDFRLVQNWNGIVAAKVKSFQGTDIIQDVVYINSSWFRYEKADDSLSVLMDLHQALNVLTPTELDVHAQGMKASYLYSNWTLGLNEQFVLDPEIVTFSPPTKDSYVDQENPDTNYGSSTNIHSRSWSAKNRRVYVEFDTSSIPNDAVIQSVLLKLYVSDFNTGGIGQSVNRVTGAWTEGGVTWNSQPSVAAPVKEQSILVEGWWNVDVTNIFVLGDSFGVRVKVTTEDSTNEKNFQIRSKFYGSTGPKLTITYVAPSEPVIGVFNAPALTYSNKSFLVSAVVNNEYSILDFHNATVEISQGIILEWQNSTNIFSLQADPSGHCVFNSGTRSSYNSTAYTLSWNISLLSGFPEGSWSVVEGKVYNSMGYNVSSESDISSFAVSTPVLTIVSPEQVDSETSFLLNVSVSHKAGFDSVDFVLVEFEGAVLKYNVTADVFSEVSDTLDLVSLNGGLKGVVDSESSVLSWNISLAEVIDEKWVDVNASALDVESFSGVKFEADLFYFNIPEQGSSPSTSYTPASNVNVEEEAPVDTSITEEGEAFLREFGTTILIGMVLIVFLWRGFVYVFRPTKVVNTLNALSRGTVQSESKGAASSWRTVLVIVVLLAVLGVLVFTPVGVWLRGVLSF